ncbi:AtpZ/AtpI family protein [Fusibacter paucivorans]|uniref:AtpZ/AtpI family protein n=2 Tax=Fusibacter paucivorans TaxID=76009 RepID=A0ABS5PKW3_9FIRM|nr:AtpZ/AtpI family protein [Fusibacter paucivorans]
MENLALLSQVGIMMITPIFGGVFIGQFLDRKFGNGSLFLIVGIVLGVGAAFRNLYQLAQTKGREYQDSETPERYVQRFEREVMQERRKAAEDAEKHTDETNGDKTKS